MKFFESEQKFKGQIDASVIFGGITRNSGKYITPAIQSLRRMGNRFRTHEIVMFENDSEDNTVDLLKKEAVTVIQETHNVPAYHGIDNCTTESIKRLASYRATLHKYITSNYYADFVVIVDPDIIALSWDGFFNSFFYHNWDVIGADGKASRKIHGKEQFLFYDCFAYRDKGQVDPDTNQIHKYAKVLEPQLIAVDSVFGGVCIYQWEAFCAGQYGARENTCDHVVFHESLRKKGFDKIYMNTYMVVIHQ